MPLAASVIEEPSIIHSWHELGIDVFVVQQYSLNLTLDSPNLGDF